MAGLYGGVAIADWVPAAPADGPVHVDAIKGTSGDDVLTGTDGTPWAGGDVSMVSTSQSGAALKDTYLQGFSSDGQKMLFADYSGGGYGLLFLKDLSTGEVTQVGSSGNGVLSGDGGTVVYTTTAQFDHGQSFVQVMVEDLETGAEHQIARVRGGSALAVSNDGQEIAYTVPIGTKHHIRGSQLYVTGHGVVWSGGKGDYASGLKFQQDGSLSFIAGHQSHEVDLWRDGEGRVNLATNAAGDKANGYIDSYSLSADLSKLVFTSNATNLVDGDTNGTYDVFVKDLSTGAVERITGVGGAEADGFTFGAVISTNGELVAFCSDADNLVAGDTDGVRDVFLKNLVTGETLLLCQAANAVSLQFTPDGQHLAITTDQAGLVAGDVDNASEIFIKDLFTAQDDKLSGLAGDDTLSGLAGDDVLKGGAGDDLLAGGLGSDKLNGGGGVDTADYSASSAIVLSLQHGTESDFSGQDTLSKIENAVGSAFADAITGDNKANLLAGGEGADTIAGGIGADTLQGQGGDDVLRGGAGADVLDGGDGFDAIDYSGSAGVSVDFVAHTVTTPGGVDSFIDIEQARLGAGADTVAGSDGQDQVTDLGGDNSFQMGGGDDIVSITGDGASDIGLGDGADTLTISGAGTASIDAGDGDDHVTLSGSLSATIFGGAGVDVLTGGGGDDLIWAADGSLPYSGIDSLYGGGGNDTLHGGRFQDGGAGNDDLSSLNATLSGGDGNDVFHGGPVVLGGNGDDYVYWNGGSADGGADGDTLDLTGWGDGGGGAVVNLSTGAVTVTSGNGTVHNFEVVKGTLFDDQISAANVATTLQGQDGADTLTGGSAADHLDGGSGDDLLTGSGGGDVLTGGAGADTFVFNATGDAPNATPDEITDLENGDIIDLHAIDANAIAAGDQAFTIVGGFSHNFGELVIHYDAVHDVTLIQGDVDGDGQADFTIKADGDHHDFSNFVL